MTLETTISEKWYSGDGASVTFDIPFPFFDTTDLTFYLLAPGADAPLTTNAISVVGAGLDATVRSFTLSAPPAAGYEIGVVRELPVTQPTSIKDSEDAGLEAFELAVDRQAAINQDQARNIGRALSYPPGAGEEGGAIPNVTTRAGKALFFDESGVPVARGVTNLGAAVAGVDYEGVDPSLMRTGQAQDARAPMGFVPAAPPAIAGGAVTFDFSSGNVIAPLTLTETVTSAMLQGLRDGHQADVAISPNGFTISGWGGPGFDLRWVGGEVYSSSADGVDVYTFKRVGTAVFCSAVNYASAV